MLVLLLPFITKRSDIIWMLIIALVASLLLSHGLKNIFNLPRPAKILDPDSFIIIGPKLTSHSFPSGHATSAFTIVLVLTYVYKQYWLHINTIFLALLISLSRIAVGAHWPVDVAAGIFCGWMSANIGIVLYFKFKEKLRNINQTGIIIILLIAALCLLIVHNTGYDQAFHFQILISIYAMSCCVYYLYLNIINKI